VEREALMTVEPSTNLGMLVHSIVIENDVNDFLGWGLRLDGVQEANELLMTVALQGPPQMFLRRVAVPNQSLEAPTYRRRDREGNASSHAPESHTPARPGIPNGILMSGFVN
jgi:hypothetical protein